MAIQKVLVMLLSGIGIALALLGQFSNAHDIALGYLRLRTVNEATLFSESFASLYAWTHFGMVLAMLFTALLLVLPAKVRQASIYFSTWFCLFGLNVEFEYWVYELYFPFMGGWMDGFKYDYWTTWGAVFGTRFMTFYFFVKAFTFFPGKLDSKSLAMFLSTKSSRKARHSLLRRPLNWWRFSELQLARFVPMLGPEAKPLRIYAAENFELVTSIRAVLPVPIIYFSFYVIAHMVGQNWRELLGAKILFGIFLAYICLLVITWLQLIWDKLVYDFKTGDVTTRNKISAILSGSAITVVSPILLAFGLYLTALFANLYGGQIDDSFVMRWQIWDRVLLSYLFGLSTIVPTVLYICFTGCVLFAILRRGAIDARLALQKTTIFSIMSIVVTAIFVAIEGAVTSQWLQWMGIPDQAGTLAGGAAAALFFAPIRNKIEVGVGSWVNRVIPVSTLAESARYNAVVVFCDVCGYTELSRKDESTALIVAAIFHKEGRATSERCRGRLVKTMGDGLILEFEYIGDAIQCCQELNTRLKLGCLAMELPEMSMHSGMHRGEVAQAHDGDIFGQTVNLAARLEGLGGENQLVLSDACLAGLEVGSEEIEEREPIKIKGYSAPIKCYSMWL